MTSGTEHVCRLPSGPDFFGQKWRCFCDQRWIGRHGDGMLTPPRPYWKDVHPLLHLGGYGKRRVS